MVKNLKIFPLDISIHWRYLHQDAGKIYLEISKTRSYWKYSKAAASIHMEKNIGDLVADLWKNNLRRPPNLSFQQKRNIFRKIKNFQEDMGDFGVKRVKAGVSPFVREETIHRIRGKAGLNVLMFRGNRYWPKITWNWGLSLLENSFVNLQQTFWEESVGVLLIKWTLLTKLEFQELWLDESLNKDMISVSLEKEVTKTQKGILLT